MLFGFWVFPDCTFLDISRLTKIAIWLGLVGLGLLLLVIASGVAHPNPLFNYGSVIGLLLLVFSIFSLLLGGCSI